MAYEQCFPGDWKSISSPPMESSEIQDGCFDCNICLDFAQEPVVTLCGHLYCWPCIYKWLHCQSATLGSDEPPQCPVCKSEISHTTMVPLYGRGQTTRTEPRLDLKTLPPRPPACMGSHALTTASSPNGQQLTYRNPYQTQQLYPHPQITNDDETSSFYPVAGMFGEMVYARVFGNSESLYAYPNSYHLAGSSSPRLRRQEMQADKSLNRISIFLFCCFLLCLLLFWIDLPMPSFCILCIKKIFGSLDEMRDVWDVRCWLRFY